MRPTGMRIVLISVILCVLISTTFICSMAEVPAEPEVRVQTRESPPVVVSQPSDFTLPEDFGFDEYTINVFDIFDDPDTSDEDLNYTYGDTSLVGIYSISPYTGRVTFQSKTHKFGSELITLEAFDGQDNRANVTFTITVTSVNDVPSVTDSQFYEVKFDEDTSIDGNMMVPGTTTPLYPELVLDRKFKELADPDDHLRFGFKYLEENPNVTVDDSFDPAVGIVKINVAPNFNGLESIDFRAWDTGDDRIEGNADDIMVHKELRFKVDAVDDPVVLVLHGDIVCYEDQWYNFTIQATDEADNEKIRYKANFESIVMNLSQYAGNYEFDKDAGTVKILADNNMVGYYTGIFMDAMDSKNTYREKINMTVVNVNDAPVPNVYSPREDVNYNTTGDITFDAKGTVDVDTIHGDILTYTWTSNRMGVLGTGKKIEAILSEPGQHLINLTVSDGTVSVTINRTIFVIREPVWGETFSQADVNRTYTDISEDVFHVRTSSQEQIEYTKGGDTPDWDATYLKSQWVAPNNIEIELKVEGAIDNDTVETAYYIWFVKPTHHERRYNTDIMRVRPEMYQPDTGDRYCVVALKDGEAWAMNSKLVEDKEPQVRMYLEGQTLKFEMQLAYLDYLGCGADFEMFATVVTVRTEIDSSTQTAWKVTSFDSIGNGSAEAPDAQPPKNLGNSGDSNIINAIVDSQIWLYIAIAIVAIIVLVVIIVVAVILFRKKDDDTIDDESDQYQADDTTMIDGDADNKYAGQDLYGGGTAAKPTVGEGGAPPPPPPPA